MSDLEEGIKYGQNYYEKELLYSIAISLKRIADKLELTSKPPVAIASKEQLEEWQIEWNKGFTIKS